METMPTRAGVIAHDPVAVIGTSSAPDLKHLEEAFEEGTPQFARGLDKISHDLMPKWLKAHVPALYSPGEQPGPPATPTETTPKTGTCY